MSESADIGRVLVIDLNVTSAHDLAWICDKLDCQAMIDHTISIETAVGQLCSVNYDLVFLALEPLRRWGTDDTLPLLNAAKGQAELVLIADHAPETWRRSRQARIVSPNGIERYLRRSMNRRASATSDGRAEAPQISLVPEMRSRHQ